MKPGSAMAEPGPERRMGAGFALMRKEGEGPSEGPRSSLYLANM